MDRKVYEKIFVIAVSLIFGIFQCILLARSIHNFQAKNLYILLPAILGLIISALGICSSLEINDNIKTAVIILGFSIAAYYVILATVQDDWRDRTHYCHGNKTKRACDADANDIWNAGKINVDVQNLVQKDLHCCGEDGPHYYKKNDLKTPKSCYKDDEVYERGCIGEYKRLFTTIVLLGLAAAFAIILALLVLFFFLLEGE